MKRKILFLAPYPDDRYPKDGMITRILNIDHHFKDEKRTYLYVSLMRNFKRYYRFDGNLEVFELNILLHLFEIISIMFSAENIYSHSIYQLKNIWFFIVFIKKKIILDVHGVVPEEIEIFGKKDLLFYILLISEKILFKKNNALVICVTNSMKTYYQKKYSNYKGEFLVFNIFPNQLVQNNKDKYFDKKSILNLNDNNVIVLYSGGTIGWQKVELMLDIIEKNQSSRIEYIILSVELDRFKELIQKYNIPQNKIKLKTVSQSELSDYYKIADYGFILRDDNVVNNVANPTKLIEYLFYGIIPIVLSPNIGDFLNYGYEYVKYEEFDINIKKPSEKNRKNIEIAQMLLKSNTQIDFKNEILNK